MRTINKAIFVAAALLPFYALAVLPPAKGNDFKSKLRAQPQSASPATVLAPRFGVDKSSLVEKETGMGPGATGTGFVSRYAPTLSTAASPYVLIHTGAREFDQNGTWKRHVVNIPGGNVHMTFGLFDSIASPNRNNNYAYQCYNPTSGALTFPIGSEPTPPAGALGTTLQNGGIDVTPLGRAVIIGRSNLGAGGNKGSGFMADAGSCLGTFSADTAFLNPISFIGLEPDLYIVDETTWVASVSSFGTHIALQQWATRTTDGGATWSAGTPLIQSSFLSSIFAGRRDGDGNPNNDVIWAAAPGCNVDSGCPAAEEEILVTRSTDGGQTWLIPAISASGAYEYPAYSIVFSRGITAMMVEDTFHVAWVDYANDISIIPGQHVHHLFVKPDLSVSGPRKVADCNFAFRAGASRAPSAATSGAAAFGGGFGIAHNPTMAYKSSEKQLYILWSQPPTGPNGSYADSTVGSSGHVYPINDIFSVASRNNGRSWDVPQNMTMTNNPGCQGVYAGTPCEHEDNISAAAVADSLIYVLAQIQKLPGWQSVTLADRFSLVDPPQTTINRYDEWRLYKIPAQGPCICASLTCSANPIPENLHLIPGGSPMNVSVTLTNTGIANLALDSIRYTGNLNDGVFQTTDNAVPGTPIPELGSYGFSVTLDPTSVQSYQSGLRSGQMIAYVHSTEPESPVPNVSCLINFSIYVVPSYCVFAYDSIYSGSNYSKLGSPGCIGCANPGPYGNEGMFYASTSEGYIFDGAPVIVNPATQNGPKGLRYYYADWFLRCLTPMITDSVPDGKGYYNISVKSIATGLLDSQIIYEVLFEQNTNPWYSDFLAMTVRAVNISSADIPNAILGTAIDANVPNHSCCCDPPPCPNESFNLSFDTSFTANSDGKTYTMMVEVGRDTIIGNFFDPPYCFTRQNRFFGAITIPDGAASTSPVAPRGAVAFNNSYFLPDGAWQDSQFVNRMDAVGYHPTDNISDTGLTGMGQVYATDSCPTGGPADLGFIIGAKKVTLPKNDLASSIVSRYGLPALASSFDTLTLDGPSESFTVLFVAGIAGTDPFFEACDSSISWYNQNANKQRGGDIGPFHRGDLDDNGMLNGIDVVREINSVFLNQMSITPVCVRDLNLDGMLTASDAVMELNYVFLGISPTPAYPPCRNW